MPDTTPQPSASSRSGLDWINFLAADVQSGVGPYLTIFLTAQGWIPGWLGLALGASAGASALAQLPAGFAVDRLSCKRGLLVASCAVVAASCVVMVCWPTFWPVILAQTALGVAAAFMMPTIAAITLGLVGPEAMAVRTARNETLNHAGSFMMAIAAGTVGQMFGLGGIFYIVCIAAAASAVATRAVRGDEIDNVVASGGTEGTPPVAMGDFLARGTVWLFLGVIFLFQTSNGAMLSLAARRLAEVRPGHEAFLLSACIIGAQAAMTLVAWWVGRALGQGVGRKTLLFVAVATVPVRGMLFAWATADSDLNAATIVAIQVLDGLATGGVSVISTVMAADIARGTGRFNVTMALVALTIAAGSALGNAAAGAVTQQWGIEGAYIALTAIALMAVGLTFVLPETRPEEAKPSADGRRGREPRPMPSH